MAILWHHAQKKHGFQVTCIDVGQDAKRTILNEQARQIAINESIPITRSWVFGKNGVIVDALLGIGLKGNVKDPFKSAIAAINDAGLPVLSIDVPSGLDADTGDVLGSAIRAQHTVTFITRKQGLYLGYAKDYTGSITLCDLDVAIDPTYKAEYRLLDPSLLKLALKKRVCTAHKGTFGHVSVIGPA